MSMAKTGSSSILKTEKLIAFTINILKQVIIPVSKVAIYGKHKGICRIISKETLSTYISHEVQTFTYTGWNDKIVALEKMTRFHFRLMKTSFLFFFLFVADHLLVGQLCTYSKSDRSLLSCLRETQCSTSEIGDASLYNSCTLPIRVMTKNHC